MVHMTVRVIPFNVIAFWVLLSLSLAWTAVASLVFIVRVHHSLVRVLSEMACLLQLMERGLLAVMFACCND